LDRLGSIFKFQRRQVFDEVAGADSLSDHHYFGAPLPSTADAQQVRQAVSDLPVLRQPCARLRTKPWQRVSCEQRERRGRRLRWRIPAAGELTHGRALTGALLFADWVGQTRPRKRRSGCCCRLRWRSAGEFGNHPAGTGASELEFHCRQRDMASEWSNVRSRDLDVEDVFGKGKARDDTGHDFVEDVLGGVSKSARFGSIGAGPIVAEELVYEAGNPDQLATVIFLQRQHRYAQG